MGERTGRRMRRCSRAAFALLLFVFPGWMNNALPGQSLTCPLITEGHPVGNTALTCHGKGYSQKMGTGGKMGGG